MKYLLIALVFFPIVVEAQEFDIEATVGSRYNLDSKVSPFVGLSLDTQYQRGSFLGRIEQRLWWDDAYGEEVVSIIDTEPGVPLYEAFQWYFGDFSDEYEVSVGRRERNHSLLNEDAPVRILEIGESIDWTDPFERKGVALPRIDIRIGDWSFVEVSIATFVASRLPLQRSEYVNAPQILPVKNERGRENAFTLRSEIYLGDLLFGATLYHGNYMWPSIEVASSKGTLTYRFPEMEAVGVSLSYPLGSYMLRGESGLFSTKKERWVQSAVEVERQVSEGVRFLFGGTANSGQGEILLEPDSLDLRRAYSGSLYGGLEWKGGLYDRYHLRVAGVYNPSAEGYLVLPEAALKFEHFEAGVKLYLISGSEGIFRNFGHTDKIRVSMSVHL